MKPPKKVGFPLRRVLKVGIIKRMKVFNSTSIKFVVGFLAIVALGLIILSAVGYYEDHRNKLKQDPKSNLADPKSP